MHEITITVMRNLMREYQADYDSLMDDDLRLSLPTKFSEDATWLNTQVLTCLRLNPDGDLVGDFFSDAIQNRNIFNDRSAFENTVTMIFEPLPPPSSTYDERPLSTPRERVPWLGGVSHRDDRGKEMFDTFFERAQMACLQGMRDLENEESTTFAVVLRGTGSGVGEAYVLKRIGWNSHVVSIDPFHEKSTADFGKMASFDHFQTYDAAISHMNEQQMIPLVVLALNYGTLTPLNMIDGRLVESNEYKTGERDLFEHCFNANARCRYVMAYFDRHERLHDRYCFVAEHIQRTYISIDVGKTIRVTPDGDCMFDCVARCNSDAPGEKQFRIHQLRRGVSTFLKNHWKKYRDRLAGALPSENEMLKHARGVENKGVYGNTVDLFALANIESCIIHVFLRQGDSATFLDTYVPEEKKALRYKSCTLLYDAVSASEAGNEDGGGHYDLVVETSYKEFQSQV